MFPVARCTSTTPYAEPYRAAPAAKNGDAAQERQREFQALLETDIERIGDATPVS